MSYLRVALDVPLPRLFDYACAQAKPEHIGCFVEVPFGRTHALGIIVGWAQAPSVEPEKVRSVQTIRTDLPPLPQDLLDLLDFCSRYYHHPIGEVILGALPARLRSARAFSTSAEPVAISDEGRAALRAGMKRSPVAAALLTELHTHGPFSAAHVASLSVRERRVLRRLRALGYVRVASFASSPALDCASADVLPLTAEQQQALAQIEAAPDGFRAWLLHGVTGSGKTEVYLQTMARVLSAGLQVLLLVPEIGLTPQLESTVRARFPDEPLVTLHSALAGTERVRNWWAAQRGEARIVLGTRSAVFAPLPQLGLIVVDEEHDTSYKQGESVRYSARDLAVWRARQRNVPIILGSATPALETYYAALRGRYTRLRLTQRPNARPLPSIRFVPTAGAEPADGLAPVVVSALRACLESNAQALVFINRRGYAPVLLCTACGWAPACSRCSAHLVLHKGRGRMLCHHCGHERAVPAHCAGCGNADLQPVGFGTQRIEARLRAILPDSRLLRVDRDTTRPRGAWGEMRAAITQGEVDLLVGTQLLSKGHDFAGLRLVCVLNADRSLYSTDFRAAERLIAQLLQVSGRAGRGNQPGEVLIQTAFPNHPLYAALQARDYDAFADVALDERKAAGLPPFVHQALLRAEATRLDAALQFLQTATDIGRPFARGVTLYDPTPAAMPRLQGRERAQLLVQSESRPRLHGFLDRWCAELWQLRGTRARWVLDVDPLDI